MRGTSSPGLMVISQKTSGQEDKTGEPTKREMRQSSQSSRHTPCAVHQFRHTECAYYFGTVAYREIIPGPFLKEGSPLCFPPLQTGVIAPMPLIMRPFCAFSPGNLPEFPLREASSRAGMLGRLDAKGRSIG